MVWKIKNKEEKPEIIEQIKEQVNESSGNEEEELRAKLEALEAKKKQLSELQQAKQAEQPEQKDVLDKNELLDIIEGNFLRGLKLLQLLRN